MICREVGAGPFPTARLLVRGTGDSSSSLSVQVKVWLFLRLGRVTAIEYLLGLTRTDESWLRSNSFPTSLFSGLNKPAPPTPYSADNSLWFSRSRIPAHVLSTDLLLCCSLK